MFGLVVSALIIIISLLTAFFMSITNVSALLEYDIKAAARNNAFLHSLTIGQVYYRSMVFNKTNERLDQDKSALGPLRRGRNDKWSSYLNSSISYVVSNPEEQGKIKVELPSFQ
ncbi:MAG TPA: hypothetical protein P5110_06165 [Candidatus Omnitrophota bacterium]|nr:hypothetical protein [Candidatus Omnitrophota bacterium]HRZ15077.1 hypothetical protein [Candidatus Omnitrophota bacterium]